MFNIRVNILFINKVLSSINNNISERCEKYTQSLYQKEKGGPFTNTGLTCGKDKPKKQTDCTKYGTDSGMYCCWVASDENDKEGKCYLISLTKIERSGIDGCAQFSDSYWSCGNFSNYMKINNILLGIFITSFFVLL